MCKPCPKTGQQLCGNDAEDRCLICGYCEREYVKKMAGYRTVMEIECMHCRTVYGHKDGRGSVGKTSGICPPCKEKGHGYFTQKGATL